MKKHISGIQQVGKVCNTVLVALLIFLIQLYRLLISPLFPGKCRFTPTCSEYTREALTEWGLVKGSWLSMKRILSCHPLSKKWGYNPVPRRNKVDTISE